MLAVTGLVFHVATNGRHGSTDSRIQARGLGFIRLKTKKTATSELFRAGVLVCRYRYNLSRTHRKTHPRRPGQPSSYFSLDGAELAADSISVGARSARTYFPSTGCPSPSSPSAPSPPSIRSPLLGGLHRSTRRVVCRAMSATPLGRLLTGSKKPNCRCAHRPYFEPRPYCHYQRVPTATSMRIVDVSQSGSHGPGRGT